MTAWLRHGQTMIETSRTVLLVSSAGAVAAALVKQLVAVLGGEGWDGVAFWQDVVQNGFIVVVLTFLTKSVLAYQEDARRRREQSRYVLARLEAMGLAIGGWNRVPGVDAGEIPDEPSEPSTVLVLLESDATKFRGMASTIDRIRDRSAPEAGNPDAARQADLASYLHLTDLPLMEYMLEGGRQRRPIWARLLVADLAALESATDEAVASAAHACRLRATELMIWIQHTDATIIERLVVERHTRLLASWAATERLDRFVASTYSSELPPEATLTDPLYLFVHHVRQAQQRISSAGSLAAIDHDLVRGLLDSVGRTLGALRNELRVAADLADALVRLIECARSSSAGRGGSVPLGPVAPREAVPARAG
jgi:hypothetical protein